jgi:hypothetical protein
MEKGISCQWNLRMEAHPVDILGGRFQGIGKSVWFPDRNLKGF